MSNTAPSLHLYNYKKIKDERPVHLKCTLKKFTFIYTSKRSPLQPEKEKEKEKEKKHIYTWPTNMEV